MRRPHTNVHTHTTIVTNMSMIMTMHGRKCERRDPGLAPRVMVRRDPKLMLIF
jgi:hypothetical protein